MAALTADLITRLRDLTGDDCTPYELSDTVLQYEYDRAAFDEDLTMVYLLRRLLGRYVKKIDSSNTVTNINSRASLLYDHIRDLLGDYEARAGVTGGRLRVGTFDYGLDADVEDEWWEW